MIAYSLAFLLGDLLLQKQHHSPVVSLLVISGICSFLLFFYKGSNIFLFCVAAMLSGFTWTGGWVHDITKWKLPHSMEGKPLMIDGIISSLPSEDDFGKRFMIDLQQITHDNQIFTGKGQLRLTWKTDSHLRPGDRYIFHARLKRIHGLRNPGGFDYEAWAIQNNMRATGSVIANLPQQFLGHYRFYATLAQLRHVLQQRIQQYAPVSETSHWLQALMIGERSSAPSEHWDILRATGTNHLMAIAGLHIGLIAGFIHTIVNWLWRRSEKLIKFYPAQMAAAVAALMTAWFYSGLAGFSIPTQRACIMLTFFMMASLAKRQLPPWQAWSSALIVVLLLNPLSVLSESFWLSFGTLALIIYGMSGRLAPSGIWWRWVRVQYVIGVGLLPLSLLFFQQTSLISTIANSIAIPWLGLTILPFCLLSSVFLFIYPPLGAFCLWLANQSLAGLWMMLTWFAHLDYATWTQAISSYWLLLSTVIACVLILLPAGMPGRYLGLIWLLPLLCHHSPNIGSDNYSVTVLDAGQGLAVIVRTAKHTLIFDAGPKLGNKLDAGESVVLPFLHYSGIRRVDKMIISHGDSDHIGGAGAIMRSISVNEVLTSAVDKFPPGKAKSCFAGMRWQWDGVMFELLYPYPEVMQLGNDSSCVLRISNGRHKTLLTGDIEKFAEHQILIRYKDIRADVMTAPHHGSKTSSQLKFIQAIQPEYVVFATGYRNRYHFPHIPVIQNYIKAGVLMMNTVNSGAITFKMNKSKSKISLEQYRLDNNRYWHDVLLD